MAGMVQQAVKAEPITEAGAQILSYVILRRACMDLWEIAEPPKRKPRRMMITVGPKGFHRWETDEEYAIRLEDLEMIRKERLKDIERWFFTPYARLLLGLQSDGNMDLSGDPADIIRVIKHKRRQGIPLFCRDKRRVRAYLEEA